MSLELVQQKMNRLVLGTKSLNVAHPLNPDAFLQVQKSVLSLNQTKS
jgi:hypothetical protein